MISDFSPRAEPIGWSLVIAGLITALASYGFNITPELKDLLILVGPFVLAGIVARFRVFAPDTVEGLMDKSYTAGVPPTTAPPPMPDPPGGA